MTAAAPSDYEPHVARRRFEPRRTELARTLRLARDRLQLRAGHSPRFDGELLALHVQAQHTAAAVTPLPLFLTACGLSLFAGPTPALVWISIAVAGYAALLALLRRFESKSGVPIDSRRWTTMFQAGHFASGIAWAHLATLDCPACGFLRFEIFQFAVLFLAIALTAMISWPLRHVVILTFMPLVGALLAGFDDFREPATAAMRLMLLGAVPFFAFVAAKMRDNTLERMKHQAEKDELIAELDAARIVSDDARRRAEEANLAKSRFLATMSHELRTPLNAILGFSEVISNEILGPVGNASYREYVKDIHASGQHLLDLINEILDLSRVEAGRYDLNEEAVSLVAVAQDCIGYVRLKCETKDIRLKVQMEEAMPQLWADERSVRQIVLNLLSNAVKFTPAGGTVSVRVGWTAGGGQYVSIRDNGPGIPEDEIPVVLSNFGQGSSAIKAAEQGTGLGLPIVQALLHMHDGDFVLTSKLREGTEATAVFPHSRVLEVMPAFSEIG
ncbi:two-component sensor histidine kinase [Aureimonas endophytica]|uniref:histidine kinase n=1 Tax=Aureimonas endophytica TaxID=2027858 RepID=A0A916ZCJ9_9HYPH|nr:HAMP domain-containing sensor histidine kinase [Aureimonas endophytica]GGD86720.1 two-component sensor histidine kinase [Aureimonas endophytica]